MNNKKPYIYTEKNLRDFWFYYGKTYYKQLFENITQTTLNIIKSNPKKYFSETVWILHLLDLENETYIIHDILFKLNMYLVCEYNIWIFENIDENKQWYFNTPTEPFEMYLRCILNNTIEIYATEYPNEDYNEFNIENKKH